MSVLLLLPAVVVGVSLAGVPGDLRAKYLSAIDESAQTFRCFDGSKVIPLSQFNDNYRDCPDGSDEPGTSEGPSTPFFCENKGYVPVALSRWVVGDGICDCCDGSDERAGLCPNTCAQVENERQSVIKQLSKVYENGMKQREKLLQEGNNLIANRRRQISSYETQINECKRKIQVLENIKTFDATPTPTPTPTPTDEEEEEIEDDYEPEEEPQQTETVEEIEVLRREGPSWIRTAFVRTWQIAFGIPSEDNPYLLEPMPRVERRERIDKLKSQIRDLEKQIEEADEAGTATKGQLPPEMIPLFGKVFKEGDYELKMFKKIDQKYTSCGKFDKYENGIAYFDSGAHCWQTKKGRKSTVKLICGDANKIVSAFEPTTCEYSFVFATPAICREDDITSMKNMTLPQLQTIKDELGM